MPLVGASTFGENGVKLLAKFPVAPVARVSVPEGPDPEDEWLPPLELPQPDRVIRAATAVAPASSRAGLVLTIMVETPSAGVGTAAPPDAGRRRSSSSGLMHDGERGAQDLRSAVVRAPAVGNQVWRAENVESPTGDVNALVLISEKPRANTAEPVLLISPQNR